jgi:hypothetical protein
MWRFVHILGGSAAEAEDRTEEFPEKIDGQFADVSSYRNGKIRFEMEPGWLNHKCLFPDCLARPANFDRPNLVRAAASASFVVNRQSSLHTTAQHRGP